MIYTLTANPAIDYNITCDGLEPNCVTRTRDAVYSPNGKGLNVSFALHHFGKDTAILGFFAGFSGRFIVEGAEAKGVDVHPVWTDGITRVNVFLNAQDREFNMVNAGAAVNPANEQEMYDLIDSLENMECLVVSGSVPPKASPDFLDKVMDHAHARGSDVVLDLSSSKLKTLASKKPLLIKPNHHEMREIFGVTIDTDDDARRALAMAHEVGVQNVLLTMGSRGSAYFSNGEDIWYAKRQFNIKLVSSVCAGDCTLAAFLTMWYNDRDNVESALKLALATGANVAESVGLGDFSHVDEYSKRIEVRKLPRL